MVTDVQAKLQSLSRQVDEHLWRRIVEPWVNAVLPRVAASPLTSTTSSSIPPSPGVMAAAGLADHAVGALAPEPWQHEKYSKKNKYWQAAGQRRHLHKRYKNQLRGVCAVDLSGPHEPTPMPGHRVGSKSAHYFLVVVVVFHDSDDGDKAQDEKDDEAPQEEIPFEQDRADQEDLGLAAEGDEVPQEEIPFDRDCADQEDPGLAAEPDEPRAKPLLYAALLQRKSDAGAELQKLLAQIRAEHGTMPNKLVYRVHSDKGTEFDNKAVDDYLHFHGIQHTTTQGYDPSSNGMAENGVGMLKKRARYLLTGTRIPTRWWGVAVLAAAQLFRADAGNAKTPRIPFGTRAMVTVDPTPRNAFLPRSLPATLFGPCDDVPHGYWVYQGGRVMAKANVQSAGLSEDELAVVKATWEDLETPLAPLPPPDAALYDATIALDKSSTTTTTSSCTPQAATCPACVQKRCKKETDLVHTKVWGECTEASSPPPMANIFAEESVAEPPPEDGKPEEKANEAKIRPEELIEQLSLKPVVFHAASAQTGIAKPDAVDLIRSHPHAAIAALACSSTGATRGTGSTLDLDSSARSTDTGEPNEEDDLDDFDDGDWDTGTLLPTTLSVVQDSHSEPAQESVAELAEAEDDEHDEMQRWTVNWRSRRRGRSTWAMHRDECLTKMNKKLQEATVAMTILDEQAKSYELPDAVLHGLDLEEDVDLTAENGSRIVTAAEVKASTGSIAEGWVRAVENEFNVNFTGRNVFTISTAAERKEYGTPLPMKMVYTQKGDKRQKARAVVCGNLERQDPTQTVWTAQAETSSLVGALRLGARRGWTVGAVDVSGAFMYAPLPKGHLVVVRPPRAFVEAGLAGPDDCWTLHRAVYGLRVSPKAWGQERDVQLRAMRWSAEGPQQQQSQYRLVQSASDTQVWMIKRVGEDSVLGLVVVYVDDFLILAPDCDFRMKFKEEMAKIWDICDEKVLTENSPLRFWGLELEKNAKGDIKMHQHKFITDMLIKHGYSKCNGITHITMEAVSEELPPSASELRTLQSYAGELNWLATRSRADLAYDVSVLASCLVKYPQWALRFWKKIMRYIRGTQDAAIILPASGDETLLEVWSDAGFGGAEQERSRSQDFSWLGAVLQSSGGAPAKASAL